MIDLTPPMRQGTAADASELAELVNFAGDGLPLCIWSEMAKDDQDPWDVGRAIQADRAEKEMVYVVDEGTGPVAGLIGYPIGSEPGAIDADTPSILRPLLELSNQALMTWNIFVLACYPAQRGQGYGTQLLALAEELARAADRTRMSLIVADTNTAARRLYERVGYQAITTTPCVRNGWPTNTRDWVLLSKQLYRLNTNRQVMARRARWRGKPPEARSSLHPQGKKASRL